MTQADQRIVLSVEEGPMARRLIDAYAYAFVPDVDLNVTFTVIDSHYRYEIEVQITELKYESCSRNSHIFGGNVVKISKSSPVAPDLVAHEVRGWTNCGPRTGHLELVDGERRAPEAAVKDLHAKCSYGLREEVKAASDNCNTLADSAVVDPENGNRLFRCPQHRGLVRGQSTGQILDSIVVGPS